MGSYPVRVRVNRARRAMEVTAVGAEVPDETLAQAEAALKAALGLSAARVTVEPPIPAEKPAPAQGAEVSTPEQPKPKQPASPEKPAPAPKAKEPVTPATPRPPKAEPQGLEAQMEAMRRRVLQKDAPSSDGGKKRIKQIYGKISGKKKPIPMGELTLDMGSVLVEGEVFNIEHRELPRRKAWVVCFDVTDLTGSIRVTRFLEGEEAKPIISQIKKSL